MTLREVLVARGLNCNQAAKQMGVEASVVYRWHRGDSAPVGENLLKLLRWGAPDMSLADAMTKLPPLADPSVTAAPPSEPGEAA